MEPQTAHLEAEGLHTRPVAGHGSGNRTTLYLTPRHAQAGLIKSMIANVHGAVPHVKATAEPLPKIDRWRVLLAYSCQRIVGQIELPTPPPTHSAPG